MNKTIHREQDFFLDNLPSLRMKAIMRWGFVLLMVFLPLFKRINGSSNFALSFFELSVLFSILFLSTLIFSFLVFRPEQRISYQLVHQFTKAQIFFDAIFITAIIYFTGGIDSNIYTLYFFPILSSILVFSYKEIGFNAIFVMLLYSVMISLEAVGVIPHRMIWDQTISIFSIPHILPYQLIFVNSQIAIFSFIAIAIQRKMKQREQRIIEEQEQFNAMTSEFISVAAHQLRTPLTSVKWFFTSLIEDGVPFSVRHEKLLHEAHARNSQMIEMVNDLLHISEIDHEEPLFEMGNHHLSDILGAAIHTMQPLAQEKQIDISIEVLNDTHTSIYGDRKKIDIALTNVLENAVKYSPHNSTVSVEWHIQNQNIVIAIHDEGIGIPEEESELIFLRFFRAKNAKQYMLTGSGLGLFIVEKIITAHNGRIWFESIEGAGTTFYIQLPVE